MDTMRPSEGRDTGSIPVEGNKYMNNEKNLELSQNPELILNKVRELFRLAEISDYTYENHPDGVHFKIRTTPEHIKERRKQMATLLGALEPTQFIKDKIIPLKNLLLQKKELKFSFIGVNPELGYIEVLISKSPQQ